MAQELRQGEWLDLQGPGYKLQVTQFSNKGPLILVTDANGKELGRARFSLDGGKWILVPSEEGGD